MAARSVPHSHRIGELRSSKHDLGLRDEIHIEELAWVARLLWHLLSFRSRTYPCSSELAFYIALRTDVGPRTGPLPWVAERRLLRADSNTTIDTITRWFSYCQMGSKPSALHEVVADALELVNDHFLTHDAMGGANQEQLLPVPAIAYTTNYDRLLENVFDDRRRTYHVAYPVTVTRSHASDGKARSQPSQQQHPKDGTALAWILQTVTFPETESYPLVGWSDCTSMILRDLRPRLKGPLIVKLHGSPLHQLPDDDWCSARGYSSITHHVVLSESSYLKWILSRKDMPPWVEEELNKSSRMLFFLGYSVSDLNIRLRLLRTAQESSVLLTPGRRAVVDRRTDRLRQAVFELLRVAVFQDDLDQFTSILQHELRAAR
jgi:hypothetical protein